MPPINPKQDSRLASRFVLSLGARRGKYASRTTFEAIVVHTTGGGILRRFAREGTKKGDKTPFDTAVRVYASIMEAGPHYVVGQEGQIVQVASETLAAWHVGSKHSAVYATTKWPDAAHAWWRQRWVGLRSPLDLAGGKLWSPSCNTVSVGIELVPPVAGERVAWSALARAAVASLVQDIAARRGIALTSDRVISHSDAHPVSRTIKNKPWDPGETQWRGWDELVQSVAPPPMPADVA